MAEKWVNFCHPKLIFNLIDSVFCPAQQSTLSAAIFPPSPFNSACLYLHLTCRLAKLDPLRLSMMMDGKPALHSNSVGRQRFQLLSQPARLLDGKLSRGANSIGCSYGQLVFVSDSSLAKPSLPLVNSISSRLQLIDWLQRAQPCVREPARFTYCLSLVYRRP